MKKVNLLFFALLFIIINTTAQNQQIIVGQNYVNPNEVTLVAERGTSTTLKFDLNELNLMEVETDYGMAYQITSEKASFILEKGAPEIFYLTAAIIIPDAGASVLDIVYGEYTDFENIEIAPSKGHLLRSVDPTTVPYVKGEVYEQDAFFPGTVATLNDPFIIRDVRGQSLFVYPVQYNPVTKILRVYSELTITVNNTQDAGINELTTQKRHNTVEPAFHGMYNDMFINYSSLSRAFPLGEEGELLVICHPAFMDAMQPYVDWKRTIGRKTTMVSTVTTGTTAAVIKNYILDYYNDPNNNLAYVLLVGDHAQIPTFTFNSQVQGGGPNPAGSDHRFGQLVGTDPYIEVFVGRFSAENVAHVQTQVQRTIHYERDLTTNDTWLSNAIGVAANEGGYGANHPNGHDGQENDHRHMNNIRTRLLDNGYETVYQEYTNNSGVPNSNATQISSRFNTGVGIGNYCNHGTATSWSLAGGVSYTNTNVNALQNAGKLPYLFSVACQNGRFHTTTCFAEAWMRATQGNQPTGAVAVLMATLNLWWAPPMSAQDAFVNICLDLPPYYTNQTWPNGGDHGIRRTFAGAALNATMIMMLRHGSNNNSQSKEDFESWLVFGDPTLQFRTKTPQEMEISHLPLIPLGSSEFSVNCDANGALCAVSYIDENEEVIILGYAVVADGVAEIVFDEPVTIPGELTLAVTGFNKVTYLSTVMAGGELELPEPQNLAYEVEYANHVILEWETPEDKGLTVKGYYVYRNDERITLEPVKDAITYTDIVPQNGEYEYVVTALYSTTLESDFSEPVSLVINGMCIPFNNNITLEEIEGTTVLVSWIAPEYEGLELAGYNIYRDAEKINTEIVTELSYLDIDLEPETEYCYQVEVVYNDCENPLQTEEKCIMVLSVSDFNKNENFSIFPNPTTGNITIEGNRLYRVEIYDMQGRRLSEYIDLTGSLKITDLNKYENGIYFVKMFSETGETAVKRLVMVK